MTYTILSAQYANADNTAVVIQTAESGAVCVGKDDAPELWAEAVAGDVAAYSPPAEPQAMTPKQKLEAAVGLPLDQIKTILAGK